MESLLVSIVTILIFVFIFLFSKLNESKRDQALRESVAWSVIQEKPQELLAQYHHDLPLWAYIKNAQIQYLSQEYHISNDDEWKFARDILEEYQKYLVQSYFKGYLCIPKSKYVIRGKDYFMLSLYSFLSEHWYDKKFLEHDMHKETLEYTHYGNWGGPLYDATYSLTDFALVFHKMRYITFMYCKASDALKEFVPDRREEGLKQIIDTKVIAISMV